MTQASRSLRAYAALKRANIWVTSVIFGSMGGGDCSGGVLWRLELSVAATGSGTDEKLCLRVGLMLLLGLYLVGPGLDSEPGLGAWRDVASIRHGVRLDLHASDSGCSTGNLHGCGSRRCALAAARRRTGEEVTARRGETGEDEQWHREWSTGQAAASSVGGEHGPRGELVPAYTTSLSPKLGLRFFDGGSRSTYYQKTLDSYHWD